MPHEPGVIYWCPLCRRELPPAGEPHVCTARMAAAATAVQMLTDGQRAELFRRYCLHCGKADPRCQCWNDE